MKKPSPENGPFHPDIEAMNTEALKEVAQSGIGKISDFDPKNGPLKVVVMEHSMPAEAQQYVMFLHEIDKLSPKNNALIGDQSGTKYKAWVPLDKVREYESFVNALVRKRIEIAKRYQSN